MSDTQGPIILWLDYGYEGWKPTSFATVKDALLADRYGSKFVITRVIEFEVEETNAETKDKGANNT